MKANRNGKRVLILIPVLLAAHPALARAPRQPKPFSMPQAKPAPEPFLLDDSAPGPVPADESTDGIGSNSRFAHSPQAVEVEMRLAQAQSCFDRGSMLLERGDEAGAMYQFDRALEVLAAAPANLPQREQLVRKYQRLTEDVFRLEVDSPPAPGAPAEVIYDKAPVDDVATLTFPVQPGLKGKVEEQLASTASQLPLEITDPVLSFINFFSSARGRPILEAGLRRAGRYAPMIRRILDEVGLPPELIFLAQAESGFLPRAMSHMQAGGMWQFIRSRGREYDLNQSPLTDDRFDPEKATRAAARHLQDLYAQFGDWYLAVAAYNCGPVNVERAIQRTGYADFWELYKRNVLPRETANYLPIILAMTIMAKNPSDYGLVGLRPDPPLEYDTIRLSASTHLALVADLSGTSLQTIRELNPAVLRLIAPAGYDVHVPKGSGRTILAALEAVPAIRRASWRVHRVCSNETVASIARRYRVAERVISEVNGSLVTEPEAGDLLMIPVSYPGMDPVVSSRSRAAAKRPVLRSARRTVTPARRTGTATKPTTGAKSKGRPAQVASGKKATPATSVKRAAKAAPAGRVGPTPQITRRAAPASTTYASVGLRRTAVSR